MYDLLGVELTGGMVIHCPEEDMAIALLDELDKRGFAWVNGGSLKDENNHFKYKHDTCYELCEDGDVAIGVVSDYGTSHITEFNDLLTAAVIACDQTAKADNSTTRKSVLEQALQTVTQDREQQYGTPENSFKAIAGAWSWYLDKEITAKDVAVLMCLFKSARVKTGRFKEDNWVDLIGYAACGAELEGLE